MGSCKECIHFNVCNGEFSAEKCPLFKHKSRFVELPCEVGSTVYFVYELAYETDNETMFIDKGEIQSFSVDDCGIWFMATYENLSSYWHTALSIGDTVFLSREEAEKALKEREKE